MRKGPGYSPAWRETWRLLGPLLPQRPALRVRRKEPAGRHPGILGLRRLHLPDALGFGPCFLPSESRIPRRWLLPADPGRACRASSTPESVMAVAPPPTPGKP